MIAVILIILIMLGIIRVVALDDMGNAVILTFVFALYVLALIYLFKS